MTPDAIAALTEWGRSATVVGILALVIWTGSKGVWMFRFVVNEWMQDTEKRNQQRVQDLLERIEDLKRERDFFQRLALQGTELASRATSTLQEAVPKVQS